MVSKKRMCYVFDIWWENFGWRKKKSVKILLQENYNDELEVPKLINLKPEEVQEYIKREIPIELLTKIH